MKNLRDIKDKSNQSKKLSLYKNRKLLVDLINKLGSLN